MSKDWEECLKPLNDIEIIEIDPKNVLSWIAGYVECIDAHNASNERLVKAIEKIQEKCRAWENPRMIVRDD